MRGIKPIKGKNGNCWERTQDVSYVLDCFSDHGGVAKIRRKSDNIPLAILIGNRLTLFRGYAHNGCSMSPDFRSARRGCEVHDALVQMLQEGAKSFTLEMANNALLEMQERDSFKMRRTYHWAVNTWFARKFMKL